jgi:hydrogenase/urease accessory protein HupE
MLFRKLFALFAVAFLLVTVPASAHDLPMGGSRWCFGKDNIVGNIDLKASLLSDIKGIKEAHYNLDSSSGDQLRQIAEDILQPYIDKRLSVTVNDKLYPIKVNKIINNGGMFTIWMSVSGVSFGKQENQVKIDYRLLFDETNNVHLNLAYGYLSDATGDELQKVFDFSQPAFRTTFDSRNQVWQLSIKGPANASVVQEKNPPVPVVKAAAQKNTEDGPGAAARSLRETHPLHSPLPSKKTNAVSATGNMHAVPTGQAMPMPSLSGKENTSVLQAPEKTSAWSAIRTFFPLGIEHILTGYDHIAFLLALIVIGLSFKEVLKVITAFTVAHSITLLLAAMQVVRLNSRFVESAIALSICYVAVENLLKKKVNYRWLVTFAFGLIHGFGFASALQDLIVGRSNLVLSVLCFNAGVETGQLMIVLFMLPLLYLLKKKFDSGMITAGASFAVFLLGFTWLIERAFNLSLLGF